MPASNPTIAAGPVPPPLNVPAACSSPVNVTLLTVTPAPASVFARSVGVSGPVRSANAIVAAPAGGATATPNPSLKHRRTAPNAPRAIRREPCIGSVPSPKPNRPDYPMGLSPVQPTSDGQARSTVPCAYSPSARIASGMSKLANTFWTSSLSSRVSIRPEHLLGRPPRCGAATVAVGDHRRGRPRRRRSRPRRGPRARRGRSVGGGGDSPRLAVVGEVLSAGVEREQHQVVLVDAAIGR